jgi:cytochrome c-type biogenesis protein CcmE
MTRKQRRLTLIGLAGLVLAIAAGLVLYAMTDRIVFFNSPSDLASHPSPPGTRLRLGGLVEAGSVAREPAVAGQRPQVRFRVTDGANTITVAYQGVLPDLFREGQGVVTMGRLGPDGVFRASEVLARHDETYMPPEVADALKRAGHWQPEQGAAPPPATWNTLDPNRPAPSGRTGS